jgi:hypothetical protein
MMLSREKRKKVTPKGKSLSVLPTLRGGWFMYSRLPIKGTLHREKKWGASFHVVQPMHACTCAPIAAPTVDKECGCTTAKFIQNLRSMSIVHHSVCWFMHGALERGLVQQGQLKNGFSKAFQV